MAVPTMDLSMVGVWIQKLVYEFLVDSVDFLEVILRALQHSCELINPAYERKITCNKEAYKQGLSFIKQGMESTSFTCCFIFKYLLPKPILQIMVVRPAGESNSSDIKRQRFGAL
ncbi:hypothetical protein WN943_016436 [Citrus x changshan-huyou]